MVATTKPVVAQPLLSQLIQSGQGNQTAQELRVITQIQAREMVDRVELVIKGTKLLTYQFRKDPEAQSLVFEFPDAVLAQDFAAPAIASEIIKELEVREDKPARKVIIVVALAKPVIHQVYLSSDAREVFIQVTASPSQAEHPTATTATAATTQSNFQVFPLVYADPEAVASILKRLIPYGENKVQVEKGRHAIVVADLPDETLAGVQQFLAEVDKPLPQVFIDAQILEINSDAASNLGLGLSNALLTTATEQSESFGQVPMGIQPFVRSPIAISATLNMLKAQGKARVLANPRVTTMDGEEASVVTGERIPIFVTETNGNQTFQIKQDIVAGIELKITPRVNEGGIITTRIRTEVSNITGVTSAGYPTTSSREATTIIRVKAGETIVIGGLLEDRSIKQTSKLPLLGDIPFLGRLFSSVRQENKQTELFIFITPYLVK
ncbi:MAG: type II secretion system protein GspD [Syntrophothermus sp.]